MKYWVAIVISPITTVRVNVQLTSKAMNEWMTNLDLACRGVNLLLFLFLFHQLVGPNISFSPSLPWTALRFFLSPALLPVGNFLSNGGRFPQRFGYITSCTMSSYDERRSNQKAGICVQLWTDLQCQCCGSGPTLSLEITLVTIVSIFEVLSALRSLMCNKTIHSSSISWRWILWTSRR